MNEYISFFKRWEKRARNRNKDEFEKYFGWANYEFINGNLDKSKEYLEKAAKIRKDADVWYALYFVNSQSIEILREGLKNYPKSTLLKTEFKYKLKMSHVGEKVE